MKKMILQILLSYLLLSCSNINRDRSVDKTNLAGDDYRLFQNTPAWELAKAVQDEDGKKIIEIIAKEPKLINYQEPKYGNTLLILTVRNQQMKSFKILLEHNADLSIHNTYEGTSALIEACSFKLYNTKYAELLLQNGAKANDVQTDKNEPDKVKTALMKAVQTGKLDLIKLLVEGGADVNFVNEFEQSALSVCVMVERYKVALYLLQNGADYKRPIFYRLDYSVPSEKQDTKEKGKPMYIADILREDFFEFDTDEYKYKMQIVEFLKNKGIDYRATPIPEYIEKKAKEKYPKTWQQYLDKY